MNKHRTLIILGLLAVVSAACAGTSGSTTTAETAILTTTSTEATTTPDQDSTTPATADAELTIANFSFNGPGTVTVGTTVTVTNQDSIGHTWTSEDGVWDSGSLSEGESFQFTFDQPGRYPYICQIHPTQMMGTITVEG